MILACPACSTRYLVAASSIGPAGRTVRCARCKHSWFQEPEPELESSGGDDAALIVSQSVTIAPALEERFAAHLEEANTYGAEQERFDPEPEPYRRDADEVDFKPRNRQPRANLPAVQSRISRAEQLGWAGLALFVVALLGSVIVFRDQLLHVWPATAKLYDSLGLSAHPAAAPHKAAHQAEAKPDYTQVAIEGKTAAADRRNGKPVLMASAMLHNKGKTRITLPPVRVEFYNDKGRIMSARSLPPPQAALEPGQRVKFEAQIADPPDEVASIEILLDVKQGG